MSKFFLVSLRIRPRTGVFLLALLTLPLSGCDQFPKFSPFSADTSAKEKIQDHGPIPTVTILTPKERRRINRRFIKDIYREVFARSLHDKLIYENWMNVLTQGASVEGVYRGLVLSVEYQKMEKGRVPRAALDFFAEEVVRLQYEKFEKRYQNRTGKKLVPIEIIKLGKKELMKQYAGAPLFSLKRVLGEAMLSRLSALQEDRDARSRWYAEIVSRWSNLGVEFNYVTRNSKNYKLHKDWAHWNSLGRIQWEILYRVHCIMNVRAKILYTK